MRHIRKAFCMATPRTGKQGRDPAAQITALILDKLERGVMPWARPWGSRGAGGRPLRHCGTPYTGINTLFLWAVADASGYRSRHWMTYRQAQALGGQVRRGEAASLSVFYSQFSKKEKGRLTCEAQTRRIRFLKAYGVFNADQIDGLPEHYYPPETPSEVREPSEHRAKIDGFFARLPIDTRHGGNSAYFSPSGDYVQLPAHEQFHSEELYASTYAHEAIHWTGGKARLDRTFGKRFGDSAYAFEELVASIGQCLVCAELELPPELHDNHASYIDHWLRILKRDNSAIIHAAAKAEAAFAYLQALAAGNGANEAPHTAEQREDLAEAA